MPEHAQCARKVQRHEFWVLEQDKAAPYGRVPGAGRDGSGLQEAQRDGENARGYARGEPECPLIA